MVAVMNKKRKPEAVEVQKLDPKSTGSLRIKPDLHYKLRIVCEAEKTSMGDWLDPLIRQAIIQAFKRVTRQLGDIADQPEEPDHPE